MPGVGGRLGRGGAGLVREAWSWVPATALYPFGLTEPSHLALRKVFTARTPAGATQPTPVVLVHGYGGNPSSWLPLERRMARAGFLDLHAVAYHPLVPDVRPVADRVAQRCRDAMASAGVDQVHLVGHSLGGIVVRYAVQALGLATHVRTAVTVAAPHAGTPLAFLCVGPLAASLRPGSRMLADLAAASRADGVPWLNCYGEYDVVVPPQYAHWSDGRADVWNVPMRGQGHSSILSCPELLRDVTGFLLAAEDAASRRSGWLRVAEVARAESTRRHVGGQAGGGSAAA